jgi:4-amino-4-deoxy-L-arabinose transferase-like glycosyltransferase
MSFVLALAAWLRLYRIGFKSLWYDEAWSLTLALKGLREAWREMGGQIYPPLHQFLLHYWVTAFGSSESSARSLSAVFGVMAVWAIYRVVKRMAGPSTALTSALLLAVEPFHVEFSQEARGYTLLVLLSLLSFDFLLAWFERRRWTSGLGYVMATVLALYTHPYALLIPGAQALVWAFRIIELRRPWRSELAWWALLSSGIAVGFLPLLPTFLRAAEGVSRDFWIQRPQAADIWETIRAFAGQSPWALMSMAITVALGLMAMIIYQGEHRFRARIYLAWWWLPIMAAFAFSSLAFSVYQTKYLIFASIPLYILAAEGISRLEHRWLKAAVIVLVLASNIQPLAAYYRKPKIEEWRGLAEHLRMKAGKNDLVLVYEENDYDDMTRPLDYYLADTSRVRAIDGVADVKNTRAGGRNIWLVVTHVGEPDSVALIKKRLELRNRIVDTRQFPGITLIQFSGRKRIKR